MVVAGDDQPLLCCRDAPCKTSCWDCIELHGIIQVHSDGGAAYAMLIVQAVIGSVQQIIVNASTYTFF